MIDYMQYIRVGKWKGITNYECALCPYATVEGLSKMLGHLQGRHKLGAKRVSPIVAADRWGQEIEIVHEQTEPANVSADKFLRDEEEE